MQTDKIMTPIEVQFSTCHPIPRLRIDGGNGVALAYLETAMKVPVDCNITKKTQAKYLLSF